MVGDGGPVFVGYLRSPAPLHFDCFAWNIWTVCRLIPTLFADGHLAGLWLVWNDGHHGTNVHGAYRPVHEVQLHSNVVDGAVLLIAVYVILRRAELNLLL